MSLFKKIFGNPDPLSSIRRTVQQKRWAHALALGESLDRSALSEESQAELDSLLAIAGDGLAELNYQEGEACLRGGEKTRAAEHFSLALTHARSDDLSRRAARAIEELGQPTEATVTTAQSFTSCSTAGCSTCEVPGTTGEEFVPSPVHFDPQTRLELILSSYPPDWAERYRSMEGSFLEAFLLAHEGREPEALGFLEQVPPEEQNELFFFERGALLGRLGDFKGGCADLEQALALDPGNLLVLDTLVNLQVGNGQGSEAESRLLELLGKGVALPFCHGRLAAISAQRGDLRPALEHGLKAISLGSAETDTLLLTAALLEGTGRLGEAEALLSRLSSGGCSGGLNVPLAEFWLRQKKNLDKALEVFKGVLRQEGGTPRWRFRIAQVYLARGWKKEGFSLLEEVLSDSGLDPELRREGTELLRSQ